MMLYLPIARDSGTFPRVCWPLEGVIYILYYANGQRARAIVQAIYTLTTLCEPAHTAHMYACYYRLRNIKTIIIYENTQVRL